MKHDNILTYRLIITRIRGRVIYFMDYGKILYCDMWETRKVIIAKSEDKYFIRLKIGLLGLKIREYEIKFGDNGFIVGYVYFK